MITIVITGVVPRDIVYEPVGISAGTTGDTTPVAATKNVFVLADITVNRDFSSGFSTKNSNHTPAKSGKIGYRRPQENHLSHERLPERPPELRPQP